MTMQQASALPTTSREQKGPAGNGHAGEALPLAAAMRPSNLGVKRGWGLGAKLAIAAGALIAVGSTGTATWFYLGGTTFNRAELVPYKVHYDKLQLTVVEHGALEAAENSEIVCRVKARNQASTVSTTIKSVIDDGSQVEKGQLLVELDDSGLVEQLKAEKITLDQAAAAKITAEENYKIVDSQNQSDIKTATVNVTLTKLNLQKYVEGDYEQSKKDILGSIKTAESDLDQLRDRAAWSARMVKKGYQTESQAQSDQSRLQSGEITLAKDQERFVSSRNSPNLSR